MNIVNYFKKINNLSWSVETSIKDSIFLLNSFDDSYISHIYREGNTIIDVFANIGVGNGSTKEKRVVIEVGLNRYLVKILERKL